MKPTKLILNSQQKWQLINLLRFFDPDQEEKRNTHSPISFQIEEDQQIKNNIINSLRNAKKQHQMRTKIIMQINDFLIQNQCLKEKQTYVKFAKNQQILIGIQKIRQKMKEKNRDSENFYLFVTFWSQLRDIKKQNLSNFTYQVNKARKLSPMERQSLQWVAQKVVNQRELVIKLQDQIIQFITRLLQYGPAQQFRMLNQIQFVELKDKLVNLLQFMQTQFINISGSYCPLKQFIQYITQSFSTNQEIYQKLANLPAKATAILQPLCREVIRLKQQQKSKRLQNPIAKTTDIHRGYNYQYLTPDMRKAQEESVNQIVIDLSKSKAANDKLENELNKIYRIIQKFSNINKLFKTDDLYREIEKELKYLNSQISEFLGIIYKNLLKYEELVRRNDNEETRKNIKYQHSVKKIIQPENYQCSAKKIDGNRSQAKRYEQKLQELISKNNKKQKQIKALQEQHLRLKDKIQEHEENAEAYKLELNNYKIQIEALNFKIEDLQKKIKQDKKKKKQLLFEKQREKQQQMQMKEDRISKSERILTAKDQQQIINKQTKNRQNQRQSKTKGQIQQQNYLLKCQIVSLQEILRENNKVIQQNQQSNVTNNQLKLKIEAQKQRNQQLQRFVHQLHEQLTGKQTEIIGEKQQIQSIKYQLKKLKQGTQNTNQASASAQLQIELIRIKQQNVKLKNIINELKIQLNHLELQTQNEKMKIYNLKQMNEKSVQKINKNKQQNSDQNQLNQNQKSLMNGQYLELEKKYKEQHNSIKEIEQKYRQLKLENSNLTKQLLKATQKNSLEKKREDISAELNRYKENEKHLLYNYKVLERTHQELKKYNQVIKKQYDKLKKETCIIRNNEHQRELSQKIKQLNQDNQRLKKQQMSSENKQIQLNSKKQIKQQQNKDHIEQGFKIFRSETNLSVENIEKQKSKYQERLKELNKQYLQLVQRHINEQQKKQQYIADQRMIILKLQQKLEEKDGQNVQIIRKKLQYLEELTTKRNNDIRNLQMELSKKEQKIMELQIELNNYESRE